MVHEHLKNETTQKKEKKTIFYGCRWLDWLTHRHGCFSRVARGLC